MISIISQLSAQMDTRCAGRIAAAVRLIASHGRHALHEKCNPSAVLGVIIAITVGTSHPASALESVQPVTWISNVADVPRPVIVALSDCPVVQFHNWPEDNMLFVAKVDSGRIYFSVCDLAQNSIDKAVIFDGENATLMSFPYFSSGQLVNEYSTSNLVWRGRTVTSRFSSGCAGNTGAKFVYGFRDNQFVLIEQQESECSDSGEAQWETIYSNR